MVLHQHFLTRHRHPLWHGHCLHNPSPKIKFDWPHVKPCDRWHWHWRWTHDHPDFRPDR